MSVAWGNSLVLIQNILGFLEQYYHHVTYSWLLTLRQMKQAAAWHKPSL